MMKSVDDANSESEKSSNLLTERPKNTSAGVDLWKEEMRRKFIQYCTEAVYKSNELEKEPMVFLKIDLATFTWDSAEPLALGL